MTRRKKTADPRLLDLREQRGKAMADAERHYARLRRAFRALEKARKKIASAERRIRKIECESSES